MSTANEQALTRERTPLQDEVAAEPSAPPRLRRRPRRAGRLDLAHRWPIYLGGLVAALYLLIFVRGLAWEWKGVLSGTRVTAPRLAAPAAAPNPPASRTVVALSGVNSPAVPPSGPAQAAAAAPAPPAVGGAGAKAPLPPSEEPPPRDAVDKYGVSYDGQGVAVMGIDADPSGVYNVAPGRQVRIGGPGGQLYDVLPGGKIAAASKVKEWPR